MNHATGSMPTIPSFVAVMRQRRSITFSAVVVHLEQPYGSCGKGHCSERALNICNGQKSNRGSPTENNLALATQVRKTCHLMRV